MAFTAEVTGSKKNVVSESKACRVEVILLIDQLPVR